MGEDLKFDSGAIYLADGSKLCDVVEFNAAIDMVESTIRENEFYTIYFSKDRAHEVSIALEYLNKRMFNHLFLGWKGKGHYRGRAIKKARRQMFLNQMRMYSAVLYGNRSYKDILNNKKRRTSIQNVYSLLAT